jgi:hypothetical protein
MAWARNGTPHTLSGTADSVEITDLTAYKFNVFMMHCFPNGSDTIEPRFSLTDNSGTGHATRSSKNGAADVANTSLSIWNSSITDAADDNFNINYFSNINGEEKLAIIFSVVTNGASAPQRREVVGKYNDGSSNSQVTAIYNVEQSSALKTTGSNLTALTGDETETTRAVQDGTIFEETDTNKAYIWSSSSQTWTQL